VDEVPALADEELPSIELGHADWYEFATLQRWSAARGSLVVPPVEDDWDRETL